MIKFRNGALRLRVMLFQIDIKLMEDIWSV